MILHAAARAATLSTERGHGARKPRVRRKHSPEPLCAQDESAADAAGPSKEARLEAAAAEAEAAVARVFQEELGVTVPLEVDALQPAGPMGAAET